MRELCSLHGKWIVAHHYDHMHIKFRRPKFSNIGVVKVSLFILSWLQGFGYSPKMV